VRGCRCNGAIWEKKSNILLEIIPKVAQNIHNDETIKKKYQLKNNMTTTLACHDQP